MALIKCPNCGSIFEEADFPMNCPMCDCKVDETFRQKFLKEEAQPKPSKPLWKRIASGCLDTVLIYLLLLAIGVALLFLF